MATPNMQKICVVGCASAAQKAKGIHVEYTFAQVGIRDAIVDYSGNCGNLSSMIGAFAIDEGMYVPSDGPEATQATVRSWNTNTSKIIDTTFPISNSLPSLDLAESSIAGVPGKASTIVLDFINPGGARTGKLLPSGSPVDTLSGDDIASNIRVSLVDATNPTVFVGSEELRQYLSIDKYLTGSSDESTASGQVGVMLEIIRKRAAHMMGLDSAAQAQPKIAILSPPPQPNEEGVDIVVHALSMGVLHKAVPMTVGLCLGVAANVKGTLAWDIVQDSRAKDTKARKDGEMVRIKHPSGVVDVGAEFSEDGEIRSAKVIRTGRRLMKGAVWW